MKRLIPGFLLALGVLAAAPAFARTLTVTNTTDSNPSLRGSLRQTIAAAGSGDQIIFLVRLPATITLSSQLEIAKNLTIQGPGARLLTIRGNHATRVFQIDIGTTVALAGLTIANGQVGVPFSGGGILNLGTLTVSNSTLSGNSASFAGGGIENSDTVTVSNSTLSTNGAPSGGGIYNFGGTVMVGNTIVANSPSGGNCFNNGGAFISLGHNLDSDGTGGFAASGDQSGTVAMPLDAKLDMLRNNGGPTQTHALLAGSPAIDAGDDSLRPDPITGGLLKWDQRGIGFLRISGRHIDIGAYERRQ